MVTLKTSRELALMRDAGRISANALQLAGELVRPGISTHELNRRVESYIRSQGAEPSFLGYQGFPASTCISVNDVVIHGIPGAGILHEGDIVSVDVGAFYRGYHGDNAATYPVGRISAEAQKLLDVTRTGLERAIAVVRPGARIGDISWAVQSYVEENGFAVVRKFVGHGVGRQMHEAPEVPNYGVPGRGLRLAAGMTLAIEPMVNVCGEDVKTLSDGWTVKTADGSLSAHFEHSVAVTEEGVAILTLAG